LGKFNAIAMDFTQSQIFKNILRAGMDMASYLDNAELDNGQKESVKKLVKDWNDAYGNFVHDNKKTWEETQYNEIIEDVTEYLAKAKALTEMALQANLEKLSVEDLRSYFWELSSLLNVAKSVFEDLE
jgi:hypothetical protein